MFACGCALLGAVVLAIALAAPTPASALSTSPPEIHTSLDAADARERIGGERFLRRTPLPALSHRPAELAGESRKITTPDPVVVEPFNLQAWHPYAHMA